VGVEHLAFDAAAPAAASAPATSQPPPAATSDAASPTAAGSERDRIALALAARARGLTGDAAGALAAADGVLAIDPESEEGFFQRSLALGDLGRGDEAQAAAERYERYRVSLETDLALRDGWRRLHPGHADESEPCHTHRLVAVP